MGTKAVSRKGRKASKLKEVPSIDDVPEFATDGEAAEFWDTHAPGPSFFDDVEELDETRLPRPEPTPVRLTVDEEVADRLKRLASQRGISYQELARQFIEERLEQEEERARRAG